MLDYVIGLVYGLIRLMGMNDIIKFTKDLINEVMTKDTSFVIRSEQHIEDLTVNDNKYSMFVAVRPDALIDLESKQELDEKKLIDAYKQLKKSNQVQSIPIQNFTDNHGGQKNLSIELRDFDVRPSEI